MIPTVVRRVGDIGSALQYECEALADADAQRGEAGARARGGELVGDGSGEAAPEAPSGWPMAMARRAG